MNLHQAALPSFILLEQKFTDRMNLWLNVESLNANQKIWLNSKFLNLDIEAIEQQMKVYDTITTTLRIRVKNLNSQGNDQLLEIFTNELKFMHHIKPIIGALGNKDLRQRHWQQIFEMTPTNFNPGMDVI